MEAQEQQVALPLRSHTILGVCEGLGEDFGFNPLFLRIPLATMVIWSPTIAFGVYFGLGLIVLASRLLFPNPKRAAAAAIDAGPVIEAKSTAPMQVAEQPREFAQAA